MVWNIMHDVDLETAKSIKLDIRFPFLEFQGIFSLPSDHTLTKEEEIPELHDSINTARNLKTPRCIKTHLSVDLIPKQIVEKQAKVVYVCRNPRDTVVSFFNHWKVLSKFSGTFDEFFELFVADLTGYYSPYLDHLLGYWKIRQMPNIHFITYEDMKKDLPSVIKSTAKFLNKSLSEEQVKKLADHLSFKNMKQNKAVNKQELVDFGKKPEDPSIGYFIRKGETGDWKNWLSDEQVRRLNEWEKKYLAGSDFKFSYEI